MKKMSGEVQLRTIADYQQAIQKLDKTKPSDLEKIKQYTAKIGELLQGAKGDDGKLPNTDLFIHSSDDGTVSVKAKNDVPTKDDVKDMQGYRDKKTVADTFGGKTKADVKQDKAEMKADKKALKQAEKEYIQAKN